MEKAFLKIYLRQRRRGILAAFLFLLIFLISFILYRLPVGAVLYPAVLCGALGLLLVLLDMRKAKMKYGLLCSIHTALDAMSQILPEPEMPEDDAYQQIIRALIQEQQHRETAMYARYAEMVEYYTLWAHQIKTPIAAMGLTLQNEDSPLARKLAADLVRIEQYVEMVLVFLRLDSESSDYLIKECDLDGIVRQAVKKFAGEFISRKLRLQYEPLSATVVTDEKWLLFVIEQVLSNALKYTPSGVVSIALEPPMTLCIRDTGIGIAPEDLPRIFEKGYTGYNGRIDKRASGIGLYLCGRVCGKLGHTISAVSTTGKGTEIRIGLAREHTVHE